MSTKKRFDRELFDEYDKNARKWTTQFLESIGMEVREHPNRYAQDLIAKDALEEEYLIECEVKAVWKSHEFPYDNVQLPFRKKKFFTDVTKFFIWNKQGTRAATFWAKDIKELIPVEVKNRYVYSGELFFQVPLDLVTFIEASSSED